MRNFVKRLARRSRSAIIIYKIFDNRRLKKRIESGDIETIHGSTHLNQSVTESLAYIEKQIANYINYAGLSAGALKGRRILELGPGDNLGVALKFLAAGAASVVCLDRFYSKRNTAHEREIYRALRETLSAEEKVKFDEAVTLTDGVAFNPEKLQTIYGDTLETFAAKLEKRKFDLILSCAVLEEIYDLDPTFAAMDALLVPGGQLIHTIDLTDYGMFRNQGMHPLTFLTISEAVYQRMASDSGLPNRKRLGYYREKMKQLGYRSKLFITSVLPSGRLEPATEYVPGRFKSEGSSRMIAEVRNRLDSEFKTLDDEELLIDGVLLVATKPL
ncbi:MAG TPA: methyltransferase domain-containing protein [Pyrinomonadaceae bacterium]|jgi:predicted TPR repeat methyltransferase|nr:methyltransferase domain-containing protein [Pyrinomonadaceae bacterium]